MRSGDVSAARGALEFERTKELIERYLPPSPAMVADIGGGPGRYSLWLAEQGYRERHRDIVPVHVAELEEQRGPLAIEAVVGDARNLDLPDGSVDAVLLLGPLYHLQDRADRAAGLSHVSLVCIEGAASLLGDLEDRRSTVEDWDVVLETARATESVPELLGIGPHLLATCRREHD